MTNTCLSQQSVFVTTKHIFHHKKSMLLAIKLLLWQNYVCHDKMLWQKTCFILTGIPLSQQKMYFVATDVFVTTKICLSWQKLLWENMLSPTNICHDKSFVAKKKQEKKHATNINVCAKKLLSQQKWCLWQLLPVIEEGFAQKLCTGFALCCPRNFAQVLLCAVPETLHRFCFVLSQKLCTSFALHCPVKNLSYF